MNPEDRQGAVRYYTYMVCGVQLTVYVNMYCAGDDSEDDNPQRHKRKKTSHIDIPRDTKEHKHKHKRS